MGTMGTIALSFSEPRQRRAQLLKCLSVRQLGQNYLDRWETVCILVLGLLSDATYSGIA
jgi:hypothetical protein